MCRCRACLAGRANSRRGKAHGVTLKYVTLADTMAWATPLAIKRVVGALRERWPDLDIALHLHDTRGMAIAKPSPVWKWA